MIKTKTKLAQIVIIVLLALIMMTGGVVFLCNEIATPPSKMEETVDRVDAEVCNIYVMFNSYGSNNRGMKFEYRVTSGFQGRPQYSSENDGAGTDVRRYSNIYDSKSANVKHRVYTLLGQPWKRFEFRSNSQGLGTNIIGGTATIEGNTYSFNSMAGNHIEKKQTLITAI